jgi:hypothetical protein
VSEEQKRAGSAGRQSETSGGSDSMDEKVERHAKELAHGGHDNSPVAEDEDTGRIAARRILEESEERVHQRGAHDHESEDVIRRSSDETAATGDDEPNP